MYVQVLLALVMCRVLSTGGGEEASAVTSYLGTPRLETVGYL